LHANHYDTTKSNYHQITIRPQLQNNTNNKVAPPTKSVIPETAKRTRGRATGYDMKSPKKKKPTEQANNTSSWANEAGRLRIYLDLVPADQSITMEVFGLLYAAKLVHIIQHEITLKDIFRLLKGVSNQVTQSGEYM
jgi:hypothetical protein